VNAIVERRTGRPVIPQIVPGSGQVVTHEPRYCRSLFGIVFSCQTGPASNVCDAVRFAFSSVVRNDPFWPIMLSILNQSRDQFPSLALVVANLEYICFVASRKSCVVLICDGCSVNSACDVQFVPNGGPSIDSHIHDGLRPLNVLYRPC
jgi:hypothetical protein